MLDVELARDPKPSFTIALACPKGAVEIKTP
jgi:hypothetical protein